MSRTSRIRVWPAPIVLGVVAAFGLIAALLSEGLGDYLSWLALGIPVVVVGWYAVPRKKQKKQETAGSAASDYG